MTGEHLSADLREFVRLLGEHGVRFLVVGGEAVVHHGYARLTVDVDFFWEREPENARRLYAVLVEFWGEPVPAVCGVEDLLEPGVILQYGRPPNRIDLLNTLGSVDFAEAWERRVPLTLRVGGDPVGFPIIGLEDLLRSKREAGRAKDLDDIEHLSGD